VAAIEGVLGVARSERDSDAPTFFGAPPVVLSGAPAAPDEIMSGGPYFLATHGSFVQANRDQAAAIASRVAAGLRATLGTLQGARVLELYAGSGGLGLWLRTLGARPTLVERYGAALDRAREAALAQGLAEIVTHVGDAADVLHRLVHDRERFDAVIVNPPRSGMPPAVRTALSLLGARVVAYVSCDPGTLTRDLNHLALLGYAARAIEPFDMMPLTDAVESLALIEPAAIPAVRTLYEDDDLIAVEKPPHLATTPQGGQPNSLLAMVRAQHGLQDLAAVHRLDLGTSGVCLFAKRKASVAPLAAALKAGEKQYLALVRGITRDKGSISRPLREQGKELAARTRYNRMQVLGGHSLLRVRPDEGRTHQIRRHLAALGHPVLGDERYGDPASNRHFEFAHGLDRTFLHLQRIALSWRGEQCVIEAELAPDLITIREGLTKQARPAAKTARARQARSRHRPRRTPSASF
jgi:23S rRNA (uracil1939-C5)-methyltransferase